MQARRRGLLRLWVAKETAIKSGDRPRPVTRRTIEVDERQRCVVEAHATKNRAEAIASVRRYVVTGRCLVALARAAAPAGSGRTALTPTGGSGAR